ncbi:hypothetical protein DYI37_04705 [Fulvimarina endophytica]|uniref:Uncharacterized protein n=1 Tax=Fulvimarina endophytica TaxID=2293836 RepID=A0A371X7D7_9HYPH|nr:hypothetical protein [Fulvimarina endophytica]RFC65155.1 hypothetical protein DYI37_04705 [Fulvimarina endophytica]
MAETALNKTLIEDDAIEAEFEIEPGRDADDSQLSNFQTNNDWVLRTISSEEAQTERGGKSRARPEQTSEGAHMSSDWAATLELVQEACESIRFSEERVAALENELEQVSLQSRNDLRAMNGRLAAAQDEIKAANLRAKLAEKRAQDAENWLVKINEAVRQGFGPYVNRLEIELSDLEIDHMSDD